MREGVRDWRTTGPGLKERIPDLNSRNIVPSDGSGGVDTGVHLPAQLRLTAKKGARKYFRRKSLVTH